MAALVSVGYQQLTVTGTATKLTPPTGLRPRRALILVVGQQVRWRADGSAPVATTSGTPVAAGDYVNWADTLDTTDNWGLILNSQWISDTGTNATLEIQYFE